MEVNQAVLKSPLVRDARNVITELINQYYGQDVSIDQKRMILEQVVQLLESITDPEKWETGKDSTIPNYDPFKEEGGMDACMNHYAAMHGKEFRDKQLNCVSLYKIAKKWLDELFNKRGWGHFNGLHPC